MNNDSKFKRFLLSMGIISPAITELPDHWIDVRSSDEFSRGSISTAVNLPHNTIGNNIEALTNDKDALLYVFCQSGMRSSLAGKILEKSGYQRVVNVGGLSKASKVFSQLNTKTSL